jgi:AraC-like DNA-binding protein
MVKGEIGPVHEVDHGFTTTRSPHPVLAGRAVLYVAYDRTSATPVLRRLAALGSIVLVVDLDRPTRRAVPGSPVPAVFSPVSGLCDAPMAYEQTGRERGVIVELTPLGARALFGLPLRELTNTSVDLADLMGSRAHLLAERLAEARDWPQRFRVLDDRLTAWMRDGPGLAAPVQGAWQQLVRSAGRTRISALAEQVGWTRQHLSSRFRDQVGLSPKTAARIVRFRRAVRLGTGPNPLPWAAVAATCGYADQAHLNLDFRSLSGLTPTGLVTFDHSRGELYLGAELGLRLAAAARRPQSRDTRGR